MLKGRPTSSFPCSRSVSDPIRISATFKDISLNQPQRLPPFEFRQLHCRSLNLGSGYAVAGGRSCRLISPLLDTHSASPGKYFRPAALADIDEIFERLKAEGFDGAYL